jgi:hypothetical protein
VGEVIVWTNKKQNSLFSRYAGFLGAILWAVFSVSSQTRLELYDAQGNWLMFVRFAYDSTGKNTGFDRTVFMSDSTFMRNVSVKTDGSGQRLTETSYNFNGDTVFQSTFGASGSSISTRDQFGVDQFGGPVGIASKGDMQYDLSQGGSVINKMTYEKDDQDRLTRVNVSDADNTLMYYGIFSYDVEGVVATGKKRAFNPAIEQTRRGSLILRVSLEKPSAVRCDLLSLSGKRVGVMLNTRLPKGVHRQVVPLVSQHSRALAMGVYCVSLSVDGRTVAVERLLVQDREAGLR